MEQKERIGFCRMFQTAVMRPKDYKSMVQVRKRTILFFIMVITFLTMFLGSVFPILGFGVSIGGPKHFITETLPDFQYKDGEFQIDQRIEINNDQLRIVADDDVDRFKAEDFEDDTLVEVLIGKHNMRMKNAAVGQNVEIDFADLGKGTFDNQDLLAMMPLFYTGIAIGLVIVYVYAAIGYAFGSFVFAVCGKSMGRMMGKELPFRQMFVYAVMAKATTSILDSMGKAADIGFFSSMTWIFVEFGIILVYLYMGIRESEGSGRTDSAR
ncbi:MAG: DUF1189 family protein [Candidatus Fimousia sp.]